jgi:hypothetical protein
MTKYVIFVEHGAASLEMIAAMFNVVAFVANAWFCGSI